MFLGNCGNNASNEFKYFSILVIPCSLNKVVCSRFMLWG